MRSSYVHAVSMIVALMLTASLSAQVPLEGDPFWQTDEIDVYSTGMIWTDIDRDGYVDVFIANGNDIVRASNYVYFSERGVLPTSASWISSNVEYSGHCAVGDIDDNGFPELVAANFLGSGGFDTPNTSTLYLNPAGWPHIVPDWRQDDSAYSFSCALGDADGDGDLDLAITTGDGYTDVHTSDRIYYNVGGTLQTTPGWESGLMTAAMDVTWGDVDNDGDLDLAYTTDNYGSVVYYNGGGTIETSPSWQSSDTNPGNTLIFGDVNGDGWLDLIVACNNQLGGGGRFRVYFNNSSGSLSTSPGWESSSAGYGSAVCLYDFDNDGDDDLSAGRWWDRPRIYENTGTTLTTTPIWQANPSTVVEELAWIDVDGDGVELYAETFPASGGKKLFYAEHHPLQTVDSVVVDGTRLGYSDYCFDLVYGWISLGAAPISEAIVYYKHSYKCDLTVSNWDVYNEAFANTQPTLVDFYADTMIGWAPLAVQFTDSSTGTTDWLWDFGTGDNSTESEPLYVYDTGGIYDVTLTATLPDGQHTRQIPRMIITLGDTLIFPDMNVASGGFTATVVLRNSLPMHGFQMPITWAGDMNLTLQTWDTDACRTAYFEDVYANSFDPGNRRASFVFEPGDGSPLPPGRGAILNLHFTVSGAGTNTLDTTSFSTRVLEFDAGFMQYQPVVEAGVIVFGICGDMDGNGTVADIADLVRLVTWAFQNGPEPVSMDMANVDGQPGVNIADIVYMALYMFQDGPPPNCN